MNSDLQHAAFYLALGALYPHPSVVQELLKPENGVSKNILDLGDSDLIIPVQSADHPMKQDVAQAGGKYKINKSWIICAKSTCFSRAIEVAKEYAHSNVVGLDLAPVPIDADKLPHNLRFEVGDINSGLAKFHGQFDLVHMRAVLSGLKGAKSVILVLRYNPS